MKEQNLSLQDTTIRQQCKHLRMPTIGLQFRKLAEEAVREQQTPVRYLEALLGAEIEERERRVVERRIREAHLPRMKTLEEFDFAQAPKVPATQIRELAEGGYVERAEPVLLIGECGTGKTHLLCAIGQETDRSRPAHVLYNVSASALVFSSRAKRA